MTPSNASSRRRALEAMGLGPTWVRRVVPSPPGRVDAVVHAPTIDHAPPIAMLDWEPLRETVAGCVACRLCETRTQTVFGVGAARPDWLVVGEAPGADEDAVGEPFVGQAGKLLDAMLAAVGRSRAHDVFIANVLKCRPPGNRDPLPDEVERCRPYLMRQIALLAPRMILVVGKVASAALLGTDGTMASLRGRVHRLAIGGRDVAVVATFNPADLLRSPTEKAKTWADLCLAREVADGPSDPTISGVPRGSA